MKKLHGIVSDRAQITTGLTYYMLLLSTRRQLACVSQFAINSQPRRYAFSASLKYHGLEHQDIFFSVNGTLQYEKIVDFYSRSFQGHEGIE